MTTNLTTNFSLPIPPLGAGGTADDYSGLMTTADSNIFSKTGGGAWTDYSATSTITGWSSFVTKRIRYKKIGSTVFVLYLLDGTSNSTAVSFTLPYSAVYYSDATISWVRNGGVVSNYPGFLSVATGASIINLYIDPNTLNWSNTGGKTVRGQFFYEVA